MSRKFKALLFVLIALVISGSVYAFAAANTVPDSNAGYKANTVPGYAVTNVVYDLDATDPTKVDAIIFDVAAISGDVVPAIVKIQTADAGSWTTSECVLTAHDPADAGKVVTCTFADLDLTAITVLNIVVSSSADPAP